MNTVSFSPPTTEKPTLRQQSHHQLLTFALVNDEEIEVGTATKLGGNTFRVPLNVLSPSPSVRRSTPSIYSFGVVCVLSIAALFFGLTLLAILGGSIAAVFLGAITATFGGVAAWEIRRIKRSGFHVVVYENRMTGQPIFSIDYDNPTVREVSEFRDKLEAAIKKSGPPSFAGDEGSMASQIDRLHRLMNEGVLTEAEFAAAKERVLRGIDEGRSIGFSAK